MVELITASLPHPHWKFMVRLHVSGDFFSQDYFDAWMTVAQQNDDVIFYAYTKSLPFWLARGAVLPKNMRLVASRGGKWDNLIQTNGLRAATVVYSEAEAAELGLPIDHDDSHAYAGHSNFALLLHGTQPASSQAAKAWQALKSSGKAGYHNQKRGRGWGGKDYAGKPLPKNYVGVLPPPAGMKTFA
jgi:hypothetical protein